MKISFNEEITGIRKRRWHWMRTTLSAVALLRSMAVTGERRQRALRVGEYVDHYNVLRTACRR